MRISVKEKYPCYLRPLWRAHKKKYGEALRSAQIWARQPKAILGVSALYAALNNKKSPIKEELRYLLTVRISQINDCHFCVDINSANYFRTKGSMEKLDALTDWQNSDLFNAQEKAALDYAEVITYSGVDPEDRHFEALAPYYDEDGLVALTGLIAFQNMSSKFNSALDIDPQGFCKIS